MIVTFQSPSRDENWSPRGLSSLIARRQSSGDDVKYLIAPTQIELHPDDASNQSCTATHPGPQKKLKNHLKANRQALKEKQRSNKDACEAAIAKDRARRQSIEQKKIKLYGKVRSRVFDPIAPSSVSQSNDRPASPPAAAADKSCLAGRSQFSPGNSVSSEQSFHIAFGRKVPTNAPEPQPNTSEVMTPSSRRHKSYGKVPSYITDRKAKIAAREEEERLLQANAPPAPGLVLMGESDRLETLRMLDVNEKEAKEALRNIPFSMNHQRASRLREAIEFRLKEIDEARKIFSRDKVFVTQEDN